MILNNMKAFLIFLNIFALIPKDMMLPKRRTAVLNNKMHFKNFCFEINPAFIEIMHNRNIDCQPLLNGISSVKNGSVLPVEIQGRGYFFGERASEHASVLEMLHKKEEPGWLYLPSGQAYYAFLKKLSISFDALKNRYNYSFLFIENVNGKRPVRLFDFTVAGENENMFEIAKRCRISVERLMELNNYKNPFEVKAGDRVVLK